MTYFINNINKNKTKKDFMRDMKSIHSILNGKDIDDLSIDEMNRLVFLHERSAISYRRFLEHSEKHDKTFTSFNKKNEESDSKKETSFNKNCPVQTEVLSVNGQKVIHIFSPFTFKKGLVESYLLAQYLNLSIKSNKQLTRVIAFLFEKKKVITHVIRCATEFNPHLHCDNDNLETSELINALFFNLRKSDSPVLAAFMSDFILVDSEEEEGMHIIVTPYDLDIYGEKLLKLVGKNR